MRSDASLAWIALNLLPGLGPALIHRFVESLGSPEAIFSADQERLQQQRGFRSTLAQRLQTYDWKEAANREWEACQRQGCQLITLADAAYPQSLKSIHCPPPVLYLRGTLQPEDQKALAVVGTRQPSVYGLSATKTLVRQLVQARVTIVSGLARGIDAAAHDTAWQAGGRSLAVLAHGLDQAVYPRENKKILSALVEQGAVLSEFPLGERPWPGNFPRRNRIISGLAQGVLVVEARVRSGALITAQWAVEQGREVFAVPGVYNASLSQGTHALIQAGAKLVTGVQDIFDELPNLGGGANAPAAVLPGKDPLAQLTPAQTSIVQALTAFGQQHVDQLALTCQLPIHCLLAELLELELQGWIQSRPGQRYQRSFAHQSSTAVGDN